MTSKQLEARLFDLLLKPLAVFARIFRSDYSFDGEALVVKRPFNKPVPILIDEFDEIGIETTSQGPFIEDVFWILKQGRVKLRIGDPHPVFQLLMERFRSLDGFDWKPFTEAMSCVEDRYFVCWKKRP